MLADAIGAYLMADGLSHAMSGRSHSLSHFLAAQALCFCRLRLPLQVCHCLLASFYAMPSLFTGLRPPTPAAQGFRRFCSSLPRCHDFASPFRARQRRRRLRYADILRYRYFFHRRRCRFDASLRSSDMRSSRCQPPVRCRLISCRCLADISFCLTPRLRFYHATRTPLIRVRRGSFIMPMSFE